MNNRYVVAERLWDTYRSLSGYKGIGRKTFDQLGEPAQNMWLHMARSALESLSLPAEKQATGPFTKLALLRATGWSVAVHNDYKLRGKRMTFWLFTRASGQWIKGEGATDEIALQRCIKELNDFDDASVLRKTFSPRRRAITKTKRKP